MLQIADGKSMEIFPCTLVYIDNDAAASPNSTSRDPCSYARQALCLNKSLLQAGMPRLNIFTNAPALGARFDAEKIPATYPMTSAGDEARAAAMTRRCL